MSPRSHTPGPRGTGNGTFIPLAGRTPPLPTPGREPGAFAELPRAGSSRTPQPRAAIGPGCGWRFKEKTSSSFPKLGTIVSRAVSPYHMAHGLRSGRGGKNSQPFAWKDPHRVLIQQRSQPATRADFRRPALDLGPCRDGTPGLTCLHFLFRQWQGWRKVFRDGEGEEHREEGAVLFLTGWKEGGIHSPGTGVHGYSTPPRLRKLRHGAATTQCMTLNCASSAITVAKHPSLKKRFPSSLPLTLLHGAPASTRPREVVSFNRASAKQRQRASPHAACRSRADAHKRRQGHLPGDAGRGPSAPGPAAEPGAAPGTLRHGGCAGAEGEGELAQGGRSPASPCTALGSPLPVTVP